MEEVVRRSALAVPTRRNRALWQIDWEEEVSVPRQGAAIDTLLMTTEACHTMTTIGLIGARTGKSFIVVGFVDAYSHLYKRSCSSVRGSVSNAFVIWI